MHPCIITISHIWCRLGSLGQSSQASDWSGFADEDEDMQLFLGGTSLTEDSLHSAEEQTSLQHSMAEGEEPVSMMEETEWELRPAGPTISEEAADDGSALSGSLLYCKVRAWLEGTMHDGTVAQTSAEMCSRHLVGW